jgi:hypothetical protein
MSSLNIYTSFFSSTTYIAHATNPEHKQAYHTLSIMNLKVPPYLLTAYLVHMFLPTCLPISLAVNRKMQTVRQIDAWFNFQLALKLFCIS